MNISLKGNLTQQRHKMSRQLKGSVSVHHFLHKLQGLTWLFDPLSEFRLFCMWNEHHCFSELTWNVEGWEGACLYLTLRCVCVCMCIPYPQGVCVCVPYPQGVCVPSPQGVCVHCTQVCMCVPYPRVCVWHTTLRVCVCANHPQVCVCVPYPLRVCTFPQGCVCVSNKRGGVRGRRTQQLWLC